MSSDLPTFTAREVIRALGKNGFARARQSGSHAICRHPDVGQRTTVPIHGKRDLGRGLVRQILNDTGLTVAELRG